ncbi:hypothetical protein [Methylocystis sp. S23]|jgi:hypothetical protein
MILLPLLASLIAPAERAHAAGVTIVAESDGGQNTATVIQTTPGEKSPQFDVKSGPGYVIVRQRGTNSRAVIIQGDGDRQEK